MACVYGRDGLLQHCGTNTNMFNLLIPLSSGELECVYGMVRLYGSYLKQGWAITSVRN